MSSVKSQNKTKYEVSEIKSLSSSLWNLPYGKKNKKQSRSFTDMCTQFFPLQPNGTIQEICIWSLKMQLLTTKI